jgi:hypothetical protein
MNERPKRNPCSAFLRNIEGCETSMMFLRQALDDRLDVDELATVTDRDIAQANHLRITLEAAVKIAGYDYDEVEG